MFLSICYVHSHTCNPPSCRNKMRHYNWIPSDLIACMHIALASTICSVCVCMEWGINHARQTTKNQNEQKEDLLKFFDVNTNLSLVTLLRKRNKKKWLHNWYFYSQRHFIGFQVCIMYIGHTEWNEWHVSNTANATNALISSHKCLRFNKWNENGCYLVCLFKKPIAATLPLKWFWMYCGACWKYKVL